MTSVELVAGQLVCLRAGSQVLLAEVKDLVVGNGKVTCWARPIAIQAEDGSVSDVRQGPDLFWPASQVQPALDVEVLAMLSVLATESHFAQDGCSARVWQFMRQLSGEAESQV